MVRSHGSLTGACAVDKEGRLLLTEEEWLARLKLSNNTSESNRPSSRKGGKKPWKSHGHTRGKEGDQKKESIDGRPIQCSNCGKRGHMNKNCWSKAQEQGEGREGPCGLIRGGRGTALFMVSASVLSDVPSFDSESTEMEIIDDDDSVTTPLQRKSSSWA